MHRSFPFQAPGGRLGRGLGVVGTGGLPRRSRPRGLQGRSGGGVEGGAAGRRREGGGVAGSWGLRGLLGEALGEGRASGLVGAEGRAGLGGAARGRGPVDGKPLRLCGSVVERSSAALESAVTGRVSACQRLSGGPHAHLGRFLAPLPDAIVCFPRLVYF